MRLPIVAGNWKMHRTVAEALELVSEAERELDGFDAVEVVICPPHTALQAVGNALAAGRVRLGAQDVHWESEGAFTGAVAPRMLAELSCSYVIVGHSERRTLFHETDEGVRRKAQAVLDAGMRPIVCVGESLEEREGGRTETVVRGQVERGLRGLEPRLHEVVIAYEPVWAIGTGKTATTEQAQSAHASIRAVVASMAGDEVARGIRILYGGSVNAANAEALFAEADVDGGLIGGASLDAGAFAAIVRAAAG